MVGHGDSQERHWLLSVRGMVLIGFTAVAAFYLWTEHRAHLYGALPYLLLLSCPLMHLFMHWGHGHQHPTSTTRETPAADRGEQ